MTKCSDSPAFNKRLAASVKKLEQRMSQYEADSPPALALQQQIDRTNARFDKYGRSELLCGVSEKLEIHYILLIHQSQQRLDLE